MKKIFLVGQGGDGVQVVAELFCKCIIESGKYASLIKAYGPESRGSKSSNIVTVDDEPPSEIVHNMFDILVAFNEKDFNENKDIACEYIYNKEYKSNINYLVDLLKMFDISKEIAIKLYIEKLEKKSISRPMLRQKYDEGLSVLWKM